MALNATPYDSAGRYLVESETREGEHHCTDVITDQCSCEDHTFRKRRCKHLDHCREVFLEEIRARIIANEGFDQRRNMPPQPPEQ